MKYVVLISLLVFTPFLLMAQPSIELSVPIGLSNYSPNSIEEQYDFINDPLESNQHISSGFEIRLSPWSLKYLEFFIGVNYLRMQYKAEQELSQESYAWTSKHTHIRYAEHFTGINLLARVNFISKQKHKVGLNLNLGYMYLIWAENWIEQSEDSYFGGVRKYDYYKANNDAFNVSAQYGIGISYIYGKQKLRWIFELGHNFLNKPDRRPLNTPVNDWSNYYISAGMKYYFISPNEQVIEK